MRRAALAALLAAVAVLASDLPHVVRAQQRTMIPQTGQIPNVVGMSLDNALSALAGTHLRIVQVESLTARQSPNTVIAQRPAAGTPLTSARAETLFWASRPKKAIAGNVAQKVQGVFTLPSSATQTTPPPAVSPADRGPITTTHVAIPGIAGTVAGTVVRDSTYVPDLRGRTQQEVARMLAELHLGLGNQATDYSDDVPSGRVFRQHPEASRSPVPTGTKVDVWYSAGPHPIATTISVPSVVGFTLANAAAVLQRTKLRLGHVDTTFVRGASGAVVHQTPDAGSAAHSGDAVDVTLAFPMQTVAVPLIIGLSRDAARAKLQSVGLDLGRITLVSVQGRDTVVIAQAPVAGTQVDPHSLVSIVENRPPVRRQVQVPDLRGMTRDQADARLRQDSLVLVASFANDLPSPVVVAQNPPAGQVVYATSMVTVTLGGTAPPTSVPPTQTPPGQTPPTQTPPTRTPPTQTPPTQTPPVVTPPSNPPQQPRPDSTGNIPPVKPPETTATTPQPTPPSQSPERYVHVPPVVGLTVRDARNALADSGLTRISLDGDSISASSIVVSQAPQAGDLVLVTRPVTLQTAVNASRVPRLLGRSEGDAHDEATRHDLVMNVQGRHRGLRWTNKVIGQTPRPLAPVPPDRTVNVDLEIPLVPPVPTAIVLLAGAAAVSVRHKTRGNGSHKLGYDPEPDTPSLPQIDGNPPSLIRTSIRLTYEAGAEPWELEPSDGSLIKKQESRDV